MLGLKLNHVSKRGPYQPQVNITSSIDKPHTHPNQPTHVTHTHTSTDCRVWIWILHPSGQGWRVLDGTRFLPRYLPVNTVLGKTGFGHPKWEKPGKTQLRSCLSNLVQDLIGPFLDQFSKRLNWTLKYRNTGILLLLTNKITILHMVKFEFIRFGLWAHKW